MIIPALFAQANLRFTGDAAPTGAEITLGLDVELFAGDPLDAAVAIGLHWNTSGCDTIQTTSITLSSVMVKFGPNATGPSAESSTAVSGTQPADAAAPNTALLVRKITPFGGRTGRGRFFIPGIWEESVDSSGIYDGTAVTAAQVALDDFYAKLTADSLIPTLLHGPGSPVSAPIPISAFEVQGKVATQRRRLRR